MDGSRTLGWTSFRWGLGPLTTLRGSLSKCTAIHGWGLFFANLHLPASVLSKPLTRTPWVTKSDSTLGCRLRPRRVTSSAHHLSFEHMSVRWFLTFPSRESERKATILWVPRFDARSKWALAPWSSFVTERGYTWHRRALRCSRMERLHRCGGQRFAFEGKPPGNHWFGKFILLVDNMFSEQTFAFYGEPCQAQLNPTCYVCFRI